MESDPYGRALVLRQSGALLAVGDTLVVGLGGRMVGFNPNNGNIRWETPLAAPVEPMTWSAWWTWWAPSADWATRCARAFQAAVGCVDAQRGRLKWTQTATAAKGYGDDSLLLGTESDGRVVCVARASGQRAWTYAGLLNRNLGSPLVLGRSVAVDSFGYVHLLSREDGTPMARWTTDGSLSSAPLALAGNTLLALTQNGNLFARRPQ